MFKELPPVGDPIVETAVEDPVNTIEKGFNGGSCLLYGSGTMALAAALMAVKASKNIAEPEVLLPAYGCPDLISGALFAGLKPVLVDLEIDTPWMDLNSLQDQIGPNSIAIIAVHFLGIQERIEEIRKILDNTDICLVEDSAQLFQNSPATGIWESDLVTLSFGRGKPVSLLGGGAVLCRNDNLRRNLPRLAEASLNKVSDYQKISTLYRLKINLYNILLRPAVYGLLRYLPFIHLGETIFKPLKEILPIKTGLVNILASNISAYQKRSRKQQQWIYEMLEGIDSDLIVDLTVINDTNHDLLLLRYPILVKDSTLRDKLFDALTLARLGCSIMYPTTLYEMPGLEGYFKDQTKYKEAYNVSKRLITLPCHSGVTFRDVEEISHIIKSVLR